MPAVAMLASLSGAATSSTTETIVVRGVRPLPVTVLSDRTVAVESVDLVDRIAVKEDLAEVLDHVPGVRVRRSGGEGSFQQVSIRGTEPDHTAVLVGDLPVVGTDRGAVDLSLFPLEMFERVEIYRGAAPAWIDQGQIGGVVRLLPRTSRSTKTHVELGAGSFGGWWGRLHASGRSGSAGGIISASALTRTNDFSFYDDNATRATTADDSVRRRFNASVRQVHVFAQGDWQAGDHQLSAFGVGLARSQGEPGPGHREARDAERERTQAFGTAAYTYDHRPTDFRLQLAVTAGWERDQFDDEFGQIGLSQELTDDRFYGLGGRLAARWGATDWLETTLVVTGRHDRYEPRNEFAVPGDQPSVRSTVGATLEARIKGEWGPVDLEVRPSASLRATEARLVRNEFGDSETRSTGERLPTLRLGLFAAPCKPLRFQGSIFWGARLPTILELFGNRGTLLANPFLRSERAVGWDVGAVYTARPRWFGQGWRTRLEVRAFGSELSDLIRYVRSLTTFTARADNVDSGRIVGVEGIAAVALPPWWRLNAQATWLDARDDMDRRLPLRPTWTASAEMDGGTGPVGGLVDDLRARVSLLHVGANFVEPANLVQLDSRTVVNLAGIVTVWRERFSLRIQLRDVLNVGGANLLTDLLGFPLPGRRLDVALTWTEVLD